MRPMAPTPFDFAAADARRSTFCFPNGSPDGTPKGSISSGVCVESIATLSSDEEARDDGMSDEDTDDLASNADDVEDEMKRSDELNEL